MKRIFAPFALSLFSFGVFGQTNYGLHFDQARYDVLSGEVFLVRVLIDSLPSSGLSSFGVRLVLDSGEREGASVEAVDTVPELDFNGVKGPGFIRQLEKGTAAAKGTVNFFTEKQQAYTNVLLATFTLRDRGTNSYSLSSALFNTLGPTEEIFVDGQGLVLDRLLTFRTALVNHRPQARITNPPEGAIFDSAASVSLSVEAMDLDGTVSKVQFFEGDRVLGEITSAPFALSLSAFPLGLHTVTAFAHDNLGATSAVSRVNFAVTSTSVQSIEIISPIRLNRQTGLFEQVVRVRNTQTNSAAAMRLSIRVLPDDVRVHNVSGTIANVPFVQYNQPLAPGGSVDFKIEYFIPDRRQIGQPDLMAEIVTANEPVEPIGLIFSMNRSLRLADGSYLVEFNSLVGRSYAIQYSSDLHTWKTAIPFLAGNGSSLQWIDSGPPKTDSPPNNQEERFYRVVLLP